MVRGKAAEGCRTPQRFAMHEAARFSARFWSAAVLCRFSPRRIRTAFTACRTRPSQTPILLFCQHVSAADFAELPAQDDRLDRGADSIIAGLQLGAHLAQERFVGQLDRATQRIAEEFSAKLPLESIAPLGRQIITQSFDAIELRAILQP